MSVRKAGLLRIQALAASFRWAIEACKRDLPMELREFPAGTCGDVTPLLGTFLQENGMGSFNYVLGERQKQGCPEYDTITHAWLEQNGLIVDITADQFPEISEPIIVTFESSWHATFQQKIEHSADYRIYDPGTVGRLHVTYHLIKRHLKVGGN